MATQNCKCGEGPYFPAVVRAEVNGYERVISFTPGWVCSVQGGKSHGRHGGSLIFLLREGCREDPHGLEKPATAVHLIISTGWCPDWVEMRTHQLPSYPSDLGYHSPEPRYEGQESKDNCPWLSGTCYSDGSGINAQEAFGVLVRDGEEALWTCLEKYHQRLFQHKGASENV